MSLQTITSKSEDTTSPDARAIRRTARKAGILYVVMSVMMVFAFMYIPGKFVVTGDAAASAQRILAGGTGLLEGIVAQLIWIPMAAVEIVAGIWLLTKGAAISVPI